MRLFKTKKTCVQRNGGMEKKMERCSVVVEAWQMQCCGTPFKVGDTVEWFVCKWEDGYLLADVGKIDFCYDHHSDDSTKLLKIMGNVTNISAIHTTYKRKSEKSNWMIPISAIAVEISEANGWDKNYEEVQLSGYVELSSYVVCLKNVTLNPITQSEVPYS